MLADVANKPLGAKVILPFDTGRQSKESQVIVRLYGRFADVEAVRSHWQIEVSPHYTNWGLQDECAVDGILNLGGKSK